MLGKMTMKRLKISIPLFILAVIIIVYGLAFNSTAVVTAPKDQPGQLSRSSLYLTESEVIFDTTVGGLMRLETGTIARTYSGKPPSACPT
jgi:hypothetical protein